MNRSCRMISAGLISITVFTLLVCGCQQKEPTTQAPGEKSEAQLDTEYRSLLAEAGLYEGGTPTPPAQIEVLKYGQLLLVTAAHGSTEMLSRLLGARNDISLNATYDGRTLLHVAAANLHATNCNLLLERGVDLNAQDALGRTALHLVVARAQGDVLARLLLSRGAAIDIADGQGLTPLMSAAPASVKLLVDKGADPAARDANDNTALHWAVYRKGHETARQLISHGAPLDSRNSAGKTALHHAVESNDLRMVELLLKAGADPDSVATSGVTPRQLAEKSGNKALSGLFSQSADSKGTKPQ